MRWTARTRSGAVVLAGGAALRLGVAACSDQERGSSDCTMAQVADLPVINRGRSPVVEAAINGRPVAFIVGSGARAPMIGEADVEALGLPVNQDRRNLIIGIGGSTYAPDVTVHRLTLSLGEARDVTFVDASQLRCTLWRREGGGPVRRRLPCQS